MRSQSFFLSILLLVSFALTSCFPKAGASSREVITKPSRIIGHSNVQKNSDKCPELIPSCVFLSHSWTIPQSQSHTSLVCFSLTKKNQSFNFQSSGAQIFYETSGKDLFHS